MVTFAFEIAKLYFIAEANCSRIITFIATMSNQDSSARNEFILKLLLRLIGTASLFALVFVAAPYSWMNDIHARLGMGPLPDEPVVGYLARSTSAFYALFGGLFWVVSFDLARHRTVLIYLSVAFSLFGATLLVIDWAEGMPLFWTVWEGPFVVIYGIALWVLVRSIKPQPQDLSGE